MQPYQSCGDRPPQERFALADRSITVDGSATAEAPAAVLPFGWRLRAAVRQLSQWVDASGKILPAGLSYAVGATYAGEPVEVVTAGGLVQILHAGLLIVAHAHWLRDNQANRALRAQAGSAGHGRYSGALERMRFPRS